MVMLTVIFEQRGPPHTALEVVNEVREEARTCCLGLAGNKGLELAISSLIHPDPAPIERTMPGRLRPSLLPLAKF